MLHERKGRRKIQAFDRAIAKTDDAEGEARHAKHLRVSMLNQIRKSVAS
jgi:hypothetical protein